MLIDLCVGGLIQPTLINNINEHVQVIVNINSISDIVICNGMASVTMNNGKQFCTVDTDVIKAIQENLNRG